MIYDLNEKKDDLNGFLKIYFNVTIMKYKLLTKQSMLTCSNKNQS